MPLWGFFVFFFLVMAGIVGGLLHFFLTQVLTLVVSGDIYLYLESKAIGLVAIILVAFAIIFVLLSRQIVGPVRRLTKAVKLFSARGERVQIPVPRLAPREIRQLIGEFAQMSANVEAAQQRDREVARVKGDFITTAAHQLRTPLTGIRWALEALAASPLSEEQKPLVENAVNKSRDLVGIVGTLLDISSIESGKYKYQFASVDLQVVLQELVKDFTQLAESRGVILTLPGGERVSPVRADRERIKWVLSNLIENAIHYTPSGGSVQLYLETGAGRVFARVRDSGIGILPQDRANIFERFFRGANAVSKENEGNGLGLYIARQIAQDHGGDLSFSPNEDTQGTTFTLSLPSA